MTTSFPRKVTQKDVARASGVSQALVSLVLGKKASDQVSEESRARITEVAERLGYRTRKDQRQRSNLLAFIYPEVKRIGHHNEWLFKSSEDFYNRMRLRLEEAAQSRGYALMSYDSSHPQKLTEWLSEWDIKGVFWNDEAKNLGEWIHKRLPLVQIDRNLIEGADSVMTDQADMIKLAMRHLVAKGHRRIAFLSKTPLGDALSVKRIRAYADFVESAGLESYDYSSQLGADIGRLDQLVEIFASTHGQRPTALIAPDAYALLIQSGLLQRGGALPDDLSIVGIDNISACDFSHPTLTSVDGNYEEVMQSAMSLMEDRLQNPKRSCRKIEIGPKLFERNSVVDADAGTKPRGREIHA